MTGERHFELREARLRARDAIASGAGATLFHVIVMPSVSTTEPMATPQVFAEAPKGVVLFAVRPAWVRIRAGDGSIVHEEILEAGAEYEIPVDVDGPTLQAGMSGSLYFEVDGELFGPLGQGTQTVRNLSLARTDLAANYAAADLSRDPELAKVIALAEAETVQPVQD